MGRYVFTPEIFCFLKRHKICADGEIQLTDAIQMLSEIQRINAYDFEGCRHDVGEEFVFIQTTIEYALKNKIIGADVKEMVIKLVE